MDLQGCMKPKVPHIAMLIVQLIYAGMALLSKTAIAQGMSPFIFVAYRQAFATIALAPFAVFLDRFPLFSRLCRQLNWPNIFF